MVGQEKLISKIDKLNLDNFPQTLLLLGERGCGKHTLCNYIASHLGIESFIIDSKVDENVNSYIIEKPYPTLYIVEIENMNLKVQNSLLKTIEEPPIGTYFIILCENINKVIPTILNRCKQWYFQTYSRETLETFITNQNIDKSLILNIASTPGQIIEFQDLPIQGMLELANNIINRINVSSPSNVLTISDRIAFKNEKEKFDLKTFLKVFKYALLNKIKEDTDRKYPNMYSLLLKLEVELNNTISQQKIFEGFLMNLWEVSRN